MQASSGAPHAHLSPHPLGKARGARLSNRALFLTLLGIFCLARIGVLWRLDAPTFGWRPTDLAGIAINYYRNGFHFWYPQVLWGGAGPGYVEMEFPLQVFLTSLLFKLFGLHDWLCLVLPLAWGFGLVWVTACFGRRLFGDIAGLAAGVITALSPTLVYITTTGLWPDPPMVFFGTLGLYLLTRWSEERGAADLWLGAASVSLAILFKLTALYLGIPVAFLFLKRYGRGIWKEPTTWLAGAGMLAPPALWYFHAYHLYTEYGNTFGIIGAGYLKFPTAEMLADVPLYKRALSRILFYHLTPLGFVAFAGGLYLALKEKLALLLVWFAAIVLHTIVVWGGVKYLGHIGYLLPIIPICSLLGGLGAQAAIERVRTKWATGDWPPLKRGMLLAALAVLIGVNVVAANHRFVTWDLAFESAVWQQKKLTGLKLRQVTRPGALIIVVDDQMDSVDQKHSMTPPDVFFFGDRRGWYLSLAWLTVEKIERMRREGAEYFVVSLQSVQKFETEHAPIHDYLSSHFRKVTDQDGLVFALARP